MINFEIEDSARKLRRAKGEALSSIDKLEALELRHWALLRQYEADQTLIEKEEPNVTESNTIETDGEASNKNDRSSSVTQEVSTNKGANL